MLRGVERFESYAKFWPFYLGEHSHPTTRFLHAVGTGFGLVTNLVAVPVTGGLWWIPLGFVVGYAFAWYSHAVYEKNRPATFIHPYWSFFGDQEMFHFMVVGWMAPELARVASERELCTPARTAYRWLVQIFIGAYFALVAFAWHRGWVGF